MHHASHYIYLLGLLRLRTQALRLLGATGYHSSSYTVCHASLKTLGNADNWSVTQSSLGLLNAVVSGHTAELDLLSGQVGDTQLENPEDPLEQSCNEESKVLVDGPDLVGCCGIAQVSPCSAGKVPEVHGRVVCNEESFAIHLLVVQRRDLTLLFTLSSGQESSCSQVVGMSDVGRLGEIKQVDVLTKLELGLTLVVWRKHRRKESLVTNTEDARGAEGACEEAGVGSRAVVLEDGLLGEGLHLWSAIEWYG